MPTFDEHLRFFDRKIVTRVSLAVISVDEYTGKQPIGYVNVFIKDQNLKAINIRSGHYVFLNLTNDECTVRTESEYYFEEETYVKLSDLDPLNPVVVIKLKPVPCYPFPPGTTLIRGIVQDSEGNSIAEAKIEVVGKEVENKTTDRGEFALYFKVLTEDDIVIEDNKKFVKGNGGKTIHLKATHDSMTETVNLEEVEECKTTTLESPIILS